MTMADRRLRSVTRPVELILTCTAGGRGLQQCLPRIQVDLRVRFVLESVQKLFVIYLWP